MAPIGSTVGTRRAMTRLTESRARRLKLPQTGQRFSFCDEVKGFGVRLTPGSRSYIVQCRYNGRKLRLTLGPVGTLPFEGPPLAPGARDLALAALNATRRDEDPRIAIGRAKSAQGITLADLWTAYVEAGFPKLRGVGRKRPTTIRRDTNRWKRLIRGHLGGELVHQLATTRVQRWLDTIATEGQRSHGLVLLKTLLSFASSRGLSATQRIAITPTKSKQVANYYSPAELTRLDATLAAMIAQMPHRILALSALRLLLLTGARAGEILSLTWNDVDLRHAVLKLVRDKTSDSGRDVLLVPAALEILRALPRLKSSPFVFHSHGRGGHLTSLQVPWAEALERAGLRRVRIHDLRHSFASTAIGAGVSLYVVGQLLGHRQAETTKRYAHLERDAARAALGRIAGVIGGGES
jgi:integrase